MYELPAIDPGVSDPMCQTPDVQATTTRWVTAVNLTTGLISAVTTGKYGAYSDYKGRRRVIMIALCGTVLNDLVVIVAARYWQILGIKFFLVGAVLDGICGSFTTTMAATHAYVTDCTEPERRAISFGYIHSSLFLGFALGPTIGAYLIKWTSSAVTVFYAGLAVHSLFFVVIFLIVPESLSAAQLKRRAAEHAARKATIRVERAPRSRTRRFLHFINFIKPLRILFPPRASGDGHGKLRRNLITLAVIDGILMLNIGAFAVMILYPEYRFGWGQMESGFFLSVVGFTRVFVLVCILPIIIRIFRRQRNALSGDGTPMGADMLDVNLIRVSLALEAFGFLLYAMVTTGTGYYIGMSLTVVIKSNYQLVPSLRSVGSDLRHFRLH